jgi:light-harvesting complex II chlorophyll a/b binding protein 4
VCCFFFVGTPNTQEKRGRSVAQVVSFVRKQRERGGEVFNAYVYAHEGERFKRKDTLTRYSLLRIITNTTKTQTVQKKSAPTPKTSRRAPDQVWYPNAEPPAWLDGSMPGDRGFDPFGLSKPVEYLQFDLDKLDGSAAKNPSGVVIGKLKKADNKPTERTIVPFNEAFDINRFRECELLHSRWAMLGVLGVIVGEATTGVAWQDAGKVELEQTQYLGFNLWGEGSNLAALTAIEVLLVGTLEFYRSAELDQEKRCYPGGAFDPLGLASKDAEETFRLKTAELKHGRLAMVAMFGVAQQALNNGDGALEALTSLGK